MKSFSIVDCYVDEPTCLGVPPYISTYPRYIAGAIFDASPAFNVQYFTIDQIRSNSEILGRLNDSDVVIFIAGITVPGKYLAGYPASPQEIKRIVEVLKKPKKILCGSAATYGFGTFGGKYTQDVQIINSLFDAIIKGDPEIVLSDFLLSGKKIHEISTDLTRKNASEIKRFAIKGSQIVRQHPYFPNRIITEIESYRGCARSIIGGCSFCVEPFKGPPVFRSVQDIHNEVEALYNQGILHFRIGNQPCLFSYQAKKAGTSEFPKPNPDIIFELFSGIRRVAPNLKTLHIDNVNPGTIAHYPEESKEIIKTIISFHTSGDVAAFGVESVDDEVIKQNNLKANKEDVYAAIKLFNEMGSKRGSNGLPELLPGLNFIAGLKGETKKTFQENYAFLEKIVHDGFLLRRINIRQVIPLPGTKMEEIGNKLIRKHQQLFKSFKYKVKMNIEKPLLEKTIPKKTILTDVITELLKGKTTFGRQLGSYPILIGIPGVYPLHETFDVCILDHGYRSITGIPFPLKINTCPREALEYLPGIGKKRAIRILRNRPFFSEKDFNKVLDDPHVIADIIPLLSFEKQ